jgi:hypothetical protein
MGICSIELLPGAANVNLTVDPFEEGDAIVRYSVEMCNPAVEEGTATVRVTDCAGNTCDVPVALGPFGVPGDLDGDGDADLFDFETFLGCENGPDMDYECDDPCRPADLDNDGDVDWDDHQLFQLVFTGSL